MITNRIKLELLHAIETGDAQRVGQVVDQLRFQHKLGYWDCFAIARELTGISAADWEELLYEADHS